ncbi:MAG: hypothetical protein ABSH46_10530 [Bryobacteraceae bacterium]|jgi:hypothetical protein
MDGQLFTLTSPTLITEIDNYHNNGVGAGSLPVGSAGIEDLDTDTFYQWAASAPPGDQYKLDRLSQCDCPGRQLPGVGLVAVHLVLPGHQLHSDG